MSTATAEAKTSKLIGSYLVNGTMGSGLLGAPTVHFSLVVVPSANSVSGTVEITQAIEGPSSDILVSNVKGRIFATGFGDVKYVVSLEGQYVQSVPPPAIGSYLAEFSAHMAINGDWNGKGGFSYGTTNVENVEVKRS